MFHLIARTTRITKLKPGNLLMKFCYMKIIRSFFRIILGSNLCNCDFISTNVVA
jgi:hypothetical protein